MDVLRNILAVPVAAIAGMFTPSLYIIFSYVIEYISLMFGFGMTTGNILFFIPAEWFWLYTTHITAGAVGGFTTIFIAVKVSKDNNRMLYVSLFLTSLLINGIAIWGNYMMYELANAIPLILLNLTAFCIAGIYPLFAAIKKLDLKRELSF